MKHIVKTIVLIAVCFCMFGCGPSKEEIAHRKNVALLAKVVKQEEAARKKSYIQKGIFEYKFARVRKGIRDMTSEEFAALKKRLADEFDAKYKNK